MRKKTRPSVSKQNISWTYFMCLVVLRLKQILKIEYFCKTATMRLFNTFWAKDGSYISQKSFVKQALGLLSFCLIAAYEYTITKHGFNYFFFFKCTINKHKFHVLARNLRYTFLSTIYMISKIYCFYVSHKQWICICKSPWINLILMQKTTNLYSLIWRTRQYSFSFSFKIPRKRHS